MTRNSLDMNYDIYIYIYILRYRFKTRMNSIEHATFTLKSLLDFIGVCTNITKFDYGSFIQVCGTENWIAM